MSNPEKIGPATFLIPKEGNMLVPGLIIGKEDQLNQPDMEQSIEQVKNVACLPGIVGYSIAMPDIHWGYGFPIVGVAAMDAESGVISPGGVGYDINCGVRLALVPMAFKDLDERGRGEILSQIFRFIPSGPGRGQREKARSLSETDYVGLAIKGATFSIEHGFGFQEDLEHMESLGVLEGADISAVSEKAKSRGRDQLGSIGSGNHFVEIGEVDEIFLPDVAEKWGVESGQIYVLIHSGSRGFGHQICQDTLNDYMAKGFAKDLPDKQLVSAPIQSPEGKQYWAAMACAANFAFNNRQQILHAVREAFRILCKIEPQKVRLLYDVCHNMAKMEMHEVEGQLKKTLRPQKRSNTRLWTSAKELAPIFHGTGQPVLIPGDMGRASHLMAGLGNPLTFCSACHGAGRARSQIKSKKAWQGEDPVSYMKSIGVQEMAHSLTTISEELPDAYKDVDEVVGSVGEATLARRVARFKPGLVLKG